MEEKIVEVTYKCRRGKQSSFELVERCAIDTKLMVYDERDGFCFVPECSTCGYGEHLKLVKDTKNPFDTTKATVCKLTVV